MARQKSAFLASRCGSGYTLIELLFVISLIGVLVGMFVHSADSVRARVEKAHCISNLKSLHNALNSYIQDHGEWPQGSVDLTGHRFEEWWIEKLEPYIGKGGDMWMCPTLKRKEAHLGEKDQALISYTPNQTDDHEFSPFRYPKQPWLIEIGALHGGGNLILFPDGSVQSIEDAFGISLDTN